MDNNNYKQVLNDLSVMADELEHKNKIIETLALKVDVLSKIVLRAGININDYLSIEEVSKYVREETE